MKILLVAFCALGLARSQLSFTSSTEAPSEPKINTRLGLLASTLGVSPVGSSSTGGGGGGGGENSDFTDGQGREVQNNEFVPQQCCCVPASEQCGDPLGREDFVGGGLIDPRSKNTSFSISTRIVNIPTQKEPIRSCPRNQKVCCYDADIDLSVFGRSCLSPEEAHAQAQGLWRQQCTERQVSGGIKQCGTRQFRPAAGLSFGQVSPGEFPWTCLLLNQNNDFIGTCALIPNDFSNNNRRGTRKVITAAHKLKAIQKTDLLKVRVGEYDASGFNPPEKYNHQEYTVVRILKHPEFSEKRLSNNIAILTVEKDIDLGLSTVNTACLPSCDDQFDYRFTNGTGTRCWVAGWGKDGETGQFQFIPRKVDLPLYDNGRCENALKKAMDKRRPGLGSRFNLSPSELCAGGEVGKDACTGDGGSPLVCQASSGRWTVVGLVTWGVGCASEVPGVYARVSYFKDWINSN